jgi:hypothetical protein
MSSNKRTVTSLEITHASSKIRRVITDESDEKDALEPEITTSRNVCDDVGRKATDSEKYPTAYRVDMTECLIIKANSKIIIGNR